jgi:non-specific serine/threonine protein kinase
MSQQVTNRVQSAASEPASTTLSTREAAARLGVHERTVRRAIARGQIPALKRHGAYVISAATIDRIAPPRPVPKLVALSPAPDGMESLPTPLTPFIGRADERAAVAALLRGGEVRLLTLTGPGGIGKTRLAIAVAGDVAAEFADGVVFVELAAITRVEFVLPTIAEALGLRESARQDLQQRVRAFLRPRRILMVLDNFEHLITAAPLIAQVLTRAPGLAVLATSRIPLRIRGEREFAVPALSVPSPDLPITSETVQASEAGRLFVDRARSIDADFTLNDAEAAAVGDVCAQLDGLPLAIELAAARVKTLSPFQLRERLDQRLPFLTVGPRDAPNRHMTLRNAIAWSYDLLSPDEQCVFRQLAVFVDGCTLEAAEQVSGVGSRVSDVARVDHSADTRHPTPETLDLVASLVEQSLLMREHGLVGEPRFRMLETIREFGLEQLKENEEATAARNAHAAYFLALSQRLRPLANTRSTHAPLDHLAADEANLRAALAWLEEHGPAADFVAMVSACYTFLFALSHFREAEMWLNRARSVQEEALPAERARLVVGVGERHMVQGQFAQADAVLAEGVALLRVLGDPFDLAMALISQGAALNYGGDVAAAAPSLQEALTLASAITDQTLRAAVAGRALANLSVSARGKGEFGLAATHGEAALDRFRGRGLELGEIRTLMDLGDIARDQGDHRRAVERYQAYLVLAGERSELRLVAAALAGIGSTAVFWGQERAALLLFGAAAAFGERTGYGIVLQAEAATLDRHLRTLRATLGDQEVDAALAEGHALPLAEAKSIAAAVTAPTASGTFSENVVLATFTPRERDVLRLLVARRTDREIAEVLFLSPRTVQWHVASLLGKLGAGSRREAAAMAVAKDLV